MTRICSKCGIVYDDDEVHACITMSDHNKISNDGYARGRKSPISDAQRSEIVKQMNDDASKTSPLMAAILNRQLKPDYSTILQPNQDRYATGADGSRCCVHHNNDGVGCRTCAYAISLGGINRMWIADPKNAGRHTCSIWMTVPADYKPAVGGAEPEFHPEICTMSQAHEVLAVTDSAWHGHQVGGDHYQQGIQPFEYAMANNLNSLEFSVVKYLRKKGDKAAHLEDLRKARHCLDMLIEWEEKDGKI